jgi:hypothetical protein
MRQPSPTRRGLPLLTLAALLPVLFFYAALFREMRNVPMVDDYAVFLDFILKLRELHHLSAKLLLILSTQRFEYKLIFVETLAALQWKLTGHVNFAAFMLAGYLCVLGLAWLIWKNALPPKFGFRQRLIFMLPVFYLLFSLSYADSLDFAQYSMQILTTPLLAFASIQFLLRGSKWNLVLACLSAMACSLCSANGLLLAPIGLCILLPRRRWISAASWAGTFCITAIMYLYNYEPARMAANGSHVPLLQKAIFYCSLLGAIVENMSRFPVKGAAIVLGVAVLATFAHSCYTRFDRRNPFLFFTALWCLLSAALIAQGRSGLGIILSLSLHYKINSVLVMIFCYLYGASTIASSTLPDLRKRQIYATALIFVVTLCAVSDYFGYKFLVNRQQRVEQGLNQFAADPQHNVPMISLDGKPIPQQEPEACRITLNRAIAAGIYTLPPPSKR